MRAQVGADWGQRLDAMAVDAAGAEIRASGRALSPRLHVLVDGPDMPYIGFLTCRRFYRGEDAVTAVGAMGIFAALLGASRLVLTWEHQDMTAALELPDAPAGQVVLDADRAGGHVLRWHPLWIDLPPDGGPGGVPVLGPTDTVADADLLPPFAVACLATWRELVGETCTGPQMYARVRWFEADGYVMRWVPRPPGERGRPWWMPYLGFT